MEARIAVHSDRRPLGDRLFWKFLPDIVLFPFPARYNCRMGFILQVNYNITQ